MQKANYFRKNDGKNRTRANAGRDCHKSVIRKSHNVLDEEKTHCNVKIGRYAAWESEFC